MNLSIRLAVILLPLLFIAACGDGPEERRRETNVRQLNALLAVQKRRTLIRDRILTHDVVADASVHFPPNAVIAEIRLKSPGFLGPDGPERKKVLQERLRRLKFDVNAFVEKVTGVPKSGISLRVIPSR